MKMCMRHKGLVIYPRSQNFWLAYHCIHHKYLFPYINNNKFQYFMMANKYTSIGNVDYHVAENIPPNF